MFNCKICNEEFKAYNVLTRHIRKYHNEKEYYDKFLIKKDEGICKICKNKTIFITISMGYKNCCSKKCSKKYTQQQTKYGNLRKYGVENSFQRKDVKEKIKITNNKKYGVNMPLQNKEIKQRAYDKMTKLYGAKTTFESLILTQKSKNTLKEKTGYDHNFNDPISINKRKTNWIKKYGCDNPLGNKKIREKRKKTMKKRYGSEHALKNLDCQKKFRNTCISKYGVEYPQQNKEIFNKQQKSGFNSKNFNNTNICYRGSYELDFLEKYYDNYNDIINAKSIKYKYLDKCKIYYPDFYIPRINLIIECKNSYLAKRDKEIIELKKKATIANGFNYILIIDKDYNEFNKNYF